MELLFGLFLLTMLGAFSAVGWQYVKRRRYVRDHSKRLEAMQVFNAEFGDFVPLKRMYTLKVRHTSWRAYQNFDSKRYMGGVLQEKSYKEAFVGAQSNAKRWEMYRDQAKALLSGDAHHVGVDESVMTQEAFDRIERQLCQHEIMKKPRLSFKTVIQSTYITKKNEVKETDYYYSFEDILTIHNEMEENAKAKKEAERFAKKQRALVTSSLRYKILKRDHFTCVLCGRSAEDGEKLHVDHIKPVTKGGLSTEKNLRTLCADCNIRKSDRYDPEGLN